ncbi:MAG: hypothetical protein JWL58_2375 [Streptosporangiaceae bacterium]|jgi:hypothetical protein|nr:hypothetical protein [Streptosporangiaceae bacterium]
MAWQLHYTSARSGPTGRGGFQFVAGSADLPPGLQAAVAPYMVYRPPPAAPLSPTADELAGFPVALAYDRVDGRPLLVRCRYLGRDYSGRYGNFFAHAVIAEPEELEGLRPIELWQAPLWDDAPGELTVLDDLAPGEAVDPESIGRWLGGTGAYDLLALLLDHVTGLLGRGHGRLVLVAGEADLIVRWIAVIAYSLPVAAAARLSFITYSADPGNAPQRLVGTTPDVAATLTGDDPVLRLDRAPPPGRAEPGRFARTATACWRALDLDGLDAIGDLAGPGAGPLHRLLDEAATLLSLCRGDLGVGAGEQRSAAALLARHGHELPGWAWDELAAALPRIGFDLAAAYAAAARDAGRLAAFERGAARCLVLALADPALAGRLPTGELTAETRKALVPEFVTALTTAAGLGTVAHIMRLAEQAGVVVPQAEVASAAAGCAPDAAEPPTAEECAALLDHCGAALTRHPALCELLSRAFMALATTRERELTSARTVRLAERVRDLPPGPGRAARMRADASAVLAHADAVRARDPVRAARYVTELGALSTRASDPLIDQIFAAGARRLAAREPSFRASLLAAAGPVRDRLAAGWLDGRLDRQARGELVSVALRVRRLGVAVPALDTWARDLAGRRLSYLQLDSFLRDDPELRAALRELRSGDPGPEG